MKLISLNVPDSLNEVAIVIKSGGVVTAPTDTVYGFLADARNEAAVRKIFGIKGREAEKALPVFVRDIDQARIYADFTPTHAEFLRRVWPGRVTAIFRTRARADQDADLRGNLSNFVVSDGTVALRVSGHEFLKALFQIVDFPLAQSSANISGQPPIKSVEEAMDVFRSSEIQPDLIVDGGVISGEASTIVDLSGEKPAILREGAISRRAIEKLFRETGLV